MVQLIPKDKLKKRPARKLDAMTPGDGLSTGRASLADLRFNDGSLARVGEQALFQFLPKTRDFKLSNGTVLLLIPPGKGQTRIQTPSAAAAIRGSALFVRYDQQTDTTIVGALTDSGIEVSNKDASETKVLEAGQMIIIIKGKFQRLYDFDLRNFYEASELVRELDLNRQSPVPTPDPAITSVQAETTAALEAQPPIKGEGVIENPSFVRLTPSPSNSPSSNETLTTPQNSSTKNPTNKNSQNNTSPATPTDPAPVTPTDPAPVTPTDPAPVTPTDPAPVTPTDPAPVTPTEPAPVTPSEPAPVTPTEPKPVTPTEPKPVTPTEPKPVTPTEPKPVTPTEPKPVTPTEPKPVTPTEPTPVTPTEPTPVTPTEPTPVTPTEPIPVTPTEPTPVTPTEPTPVTPTEPTPVTPTEPTPVTPTEPTPVTPTSSPST
jgi:acrosin